MQTRKRQTRIDFHLVFVEINRSNVFWRKIGYLDGKKQSQRYFLFKGNSVTKTVYEEKVSETRKALRVDALRFVWFMMLFWSNWGHLSTDFCRWILFIQRGTSMGSHLPSTYHHHRPRHRSTIPLVLHGEVKKELSLLVSSSEAQFH